ncbi:hypothetical protein Tco_0763898 [Tanacetum coccineum]
MHVIVSIPVRSISLKSSKARSLCTVGSDLAGFLPPLVGYRLLLSSTFSQGLLPVPVFSFNGDTLDPSIIVLKPSGMESRIGLEEEGLRDGSGCGSIGSHYRVRKEVWLGFSEWSFETATFILYG